MHPPIRAVLGAKPWSEIECLGVGRSAPVTFPFCGGQHERSDFGIGMEMVCNNGGRAYRKHSADGGDSDEKSMHQLVHKGMIINSTSLAALEPTCFGPSTGPLTRPDACGSTKCVRESPDQSMTFNPVMRGVPARCY